MEVGVYISLAAVAISFISLVMGGRKDTRTDAAQNAIIQTKLDNVISGVNDIRVELRSMRADINDHGERLARVEALSANNMQRIDKLEGKRSD